MSRFAQGDRVGEHRYSVGRQRRLLYFTAVFLLTLTAAHSAETIPPKPAGYFNDYAGIVPKDVALQLNEKLAQFERETSNQIVVAIWPNFPSASSIEDFTQRTFQAWNVGQTGKNNGAVLF